MWTRSIRTRGGLIGRRTVVIAVGDIGILAAFVAYGLLSHAINPIRFPIHSVMTAVPFLLAWWLVAPVGGLYRPTTIESVRTTLLRTTVIWTIVTLLGGAIRDTSLFLGEAPPIFLLTTLVFGLGFLLPWRLAVALWESRATRNVS